MSEHADDTVPILPGRVLWFARGTHRGFVNLGTERHRHVAVELK